MSSPPKLPALPTPDSGHWQHFPIDWTDHFFKATMLAYGIQCAREQRERDAAICKNLPDGDYNDPDMADACADAIRSQPEPVAVEGEI